MEANIRDWLTNEFKNLLEHHEVLRADSRSVSDIQIEDYLTRNDYINENNIDEHIQTYVQNNDIVTADSLSDSINEWMSENFDISDYDIEYPVKQAVRNLDFSVEVQVN